jgi:hypothetical protein
VTENWYESRFNLYGALWVFCNNYHSGQWSRGYRIISKLDRIGYKPGLSIQSGKFETDEQRKIYRELLKYKSRV